MNMKIETKYDIWDEVETLLWDIWVIVSIKLVRNSYEYCIWYDVDKYNRIEERQIKKKR